MACGNRTLNMTTSDLALLHIPTVVYLLLILVLGLFGNLFILYIYTRKLRMNIFGYFVKLIAVFDLAGTAVAVPTTLVFLLTTSPGYLDVGDMCQVMTFTKHFNAANSGLIFIIIASQRYRKICKPHQRQMSDSLVKKLCISSICVSTLMGIPIVFFQGHTPICIEWGAQVVQIPICDFVSNEKGRVPSILYAIWVGVELIGITTTLTVLYTFIAKALWMHNRNRASSFEPNSNGPSTRDKTRTATVTFFVLTVVYLVSGAPMIALTVYFCFVRVDMHSFWSYSKLIALDLGGNLLYLNYAINPFVYSLTSSLFRRECRRVFGSSAPKRSTVL
ncbi:bombesin receptor subtype-3-like [Haliotis rufescens]|uniref:bombesin receptor subtype-3-like n=1 Tax=Haliotis rufescens TaxID=6454 RepID=UPI00201F8FD4|nr:bombesin receptor subtype-3-like [Haliotis rufescens]